MKQRSGLFLLAFVIFIIGLGAGAAVYVLADEPEATAYVIIGDTAYPVDPATSKAYRRQLERFGGKAAPALRRHQPLAGRTRSGQAARHHRGRCKHADSARAVSRGAPKLNSRVRTFYYVPGVPECETHCETTQ